VVRAHLLLVVLVATLLATGFALAAPPASQPAGATPPAPAPTPPDLQDFVTSYWCNPPARFHTLERYAEIRNANFTVAMGAGGAGLTVEQNRQMLDYCRQLGMKAIVRDGRLPLAASSAEQQAAIDAVVKEYADHPALFGYYLVDEPGAGAFDGLGQVVARLREKDPTRVAYINLLPTYARDFPGALGTTTYEEHVRAFVAKVKPAVLSYDHYHFTTQGDRADFFENLDTVRRVALEARIPFWNIVLVTQHGGYRNLTEGELRFEAMQTLAYGARGLLWFTYWSPAETDHSLTWAHAMINPDGSRDPHYEQVRAVNAEVLAIAAQLKGARSSAVLLCGDDAPKVPGADPAPENPPLALADPAPVNVGVFESSGAAPHHLALLTNRDYKQPTTTRAIVQPVNAPAEQFDPATKTWHAAPIRERGVIEITLPPGGGTLLRW
jgi:hypothetical protein